jgi:hypothetical protein
MVIEISTALLDNLKLTPNEYFVITLIRQKEFDLLSNFLRTNFSNTELENLFNKLIKLEYLTSTSYLQNYHDYSRCKLSNKLYALIRTEDLFEEFMEEFPKSVVRTDGVIDYLRTDQKHCKQLYMVLTKNNRASHDHIVKCLKFEIEKRIRDGSIKFMPRMSRWLSTESWKAYEDEINSLPNKPANYGTSVE